MKKILALCLMTALAICGCQVNEEYEFATEGKVFTATTEAYIADGVETKTSMDSEGNVLWKAGDQVSVFASSTINQHYQVTDESDGKTAASLYLVTSPGFVAGGEIPNNVAFYPYAVNAGIAKKSGGYVISDIVLPETQNYAQASFGNGAFPMAAITASTSDMNLKFKNVLGGLKLRLKGNAAIASITVTGNNDEILCGAAEVTVAVGSLPSISLTDASATTVTLACGNGVQLSETAVTAFIIALPPMTMEGGFTVTVTDTEGASMEIKTTKPQTITRSNLLAMPAVTYVGTASEHQYVDLGLTSGVKWATCNVGATSPEEYGDFFAWGETKSYYENQDPLVWKNGKSDGYYWPSYQWCNGDEFSITKYCTDSYFGTVDNKTVLAPEDDAASVNWGGSWRMPTDAEWTELKTECTWTWTTQNGVNGRLVTGPNSNSIFLPAAGRRSGTYLEYLGSIGYFWSSSLNTDFPCFALGVWFHSGNVGDSGDDYRAIGFSVRPVTDEGVRVSVTNISLNQNAITLTVGGSAYLIATVTPSNATQPTVTWSSSNTSVATVDFTGKVKAVSAGSATITATTYDGGYTATCSVIVSGPTSGAINGYEWVDLGLPSGLKWASFNVGANAPEEYGDYFAWGATEPFYSSQNPLVWKSGKEAGYAWPTCPFRTSGNSYSNVKFSNYNTSSSYGPIDNKTILDPEDDAASVNWGGTWRMPTDAEWTELRTECTWTWTSQNGVNGRLVTGPNGNSIFLPAAGERGSTSLGSTGSYGYYWSSSLYTDSPYFSWSVTFFSGNIGRTNRYRYYGFSVRAVSE